MTETLEEICLALPKKEVQDPLAVARKLENRMKTAPIGIPNTSSGLFHCIHPSIQGPSFRIVDLPKPFELLNMEQKEMDLNRIILLLAPEPMDNWTQMMMGSISASIVESDANLRLFDLGTEDEIRNNLSQLFLEKMT